MIVDGIWGNLLASGRAICKSFLFMFRPLPEAHFCLELRGGQEALCLRALDFW